MTKKIETNNPTLPDHYRDYLGKRPNYKIGQTNLSEFNSILNLPYKLSLISFAT
jgi:hypothetical protein